MNQRTRGHRPSRIGLTVIEVLFAIGIAMVGLLGVASLLPLAGRNASESMRAAEGQALANLWYDELIVRGAGDPANWQYYQDYAQQNSAPGFKFYSATKQAVCIDPRFFATRDLTAAFSAGAFNRPVQDKHRWYRPAVFPYYHENYNPLVDPAYTISGTSGYAASTTQPRMQRITLGGALGRIPARYLDQILSSTDDLAIDVESSDASVAPTRHLAAASPAVAAGRLASKGEYSWLITICPTDTLTHNQPVSQALLSLVVIFRRDMMFFNPDDATSLPPIRSPGQPDTESKPEGERIFAVIPQTDSSGALVPFRGGHGGRVTLMATDGIESSLHVGDWLMLAKDRVVGGTSYPIFRWFRVVSTDGDAQYQTSSSTPNGDGVWARNVVLDGPDWVFDTTYNTTATYIPGAVAVHERIIPF